MLDKGTTAYSFVVDDGPDFLFQSLFLVASLTKICGVSPGDVYAHLTGECDWTNEAVLRWTGINVVRIERFPGESPHCNKIVQLRTLALRRYRQVVLCDCDLAFAAPVPPLGSLGLLAKEVDFPNPPVFVLQDIFREAGFAAEPPLVPTTLRNEGGRLVLHSGDPADSEFQTFNGNFNGGLYVIATEWLDRLAARWSHWASWLLHRRNRLGQWAVHVDQVSFCLAVTELAVPFERLPASFNFPIHVPVDMEGASCTPAVIHFHRQFDQDGLIAGTGVRCIDEVVDTVNGALHALLADALRFGGPVGLLLMNKRADWVRERGEPSPGSPPVQAHDGVRAVVEALVAAGSGSEARFDPDAYAAANPDVEEANADPVDHYAVHGWKEGRLLAPQPMHPSQVYRRSALRRSLDDPAGSFPAFAYWEGSDRSVLRDFAADWLDEFSMFRLYGDGEVEPLVRSYFPDFVELYRSIRIPAAKADIARLLLLYDKGGLYVDCHCGVSDSAGLRSLILRLGDIDAVFVDRVRSAAFSPRPAEEHFLINSIMLSRPFFAPLLQICRQAFHNLDRQWRAERETGFVPYHIGSLSGPDVITQGILTPDRCGIRAALRHRVEIVPEEIAPVAQNRHRAYSTPANHWFTRQNTECLFAPPGEVG